MSGGVLSPRSKLPEKEINRGLVKILQLAAYAEGTPQRRSALGALLHYLHQMSKVGKDSHSIFNGMNMYCLLNVKRRI